MPGDGKNLEALVALIERLHLPQGFRVTTNECVYDEGVQVAELDVQVQGRVGTADFKWLIECRDRPSDGPAPCAWIEQLIGRKLRFNFNKVTAVSTTGFALGAAKLAEERGIELREVRSLTPEDVKSWFLIESMPIIGRSFRLIRSILGAADNEPEDRRKLFDQIVTAKANEPILWHTENQNYYTIQQGFQAALLEKEELFNAVELDAPPRLVELHVLYPNDASRFVVKTGLGDVQVLRIDFQGEVSLTTERVSVSRLSDYVHSASGESIAQSAAFEFSALDTQLSLELHKLGDSGEMKLLIRSIGQLPRSES